MRGEVERWLTVMHYSFQDEESLYMCMEYMPGGDLMSLLMVHRPSERGRSNIRRGNH